jgi:HEAT repeat protein
MHPGYCPACFEPLAQEADTCPACGARRADLTGRDYREALLYALRHPLADVRLRVIIALGLRGEPETADALAECALRYPTDVVQGLEIVHSLSRVRDGATRKRTLFSLAVRHHAHAVRDAASEAGANK